MKGGTGHSGPAQASRMSKPQVESLRESLFKFDQRMKAGPGTKAFVSILVFKGYPVDTRESRHTILWFQFIDGSKPCGINIAGVQNEYSIETITEANPRRRRGFVKEVAVGWLGISMTKVQLMSFVYQTPVDNLSLEFNCQLWVGEALQRLADSDYISKEVAKKGIYAMVDATFEAEVER